jgi:hypothetical protein
MAVATEYAIKPVPRFNARGLKRCLLSGIDVHANGKASADFWRRPDGTIKLRIAFMGYDWSFEARELSGASIPDEEECMDMFGSVVAQEIFRWMVEDAADLPPFEEA